MQDYYEIRLAELATAEKKTESKKKAKLYYALQMRETEAYLKYLDSHKQGYCSCGMLKDATGICSLCLI